MIVAVVIVLLFGRGKISDLMGDVAKGITSFKKGLNEEQKETAETIENKPAENIVESSAEKTKTS